MKSVEDLKVAHDALQGDLPEGYMRFADDVVIGHTPESKYGFEFFRWRSPQMVAEMDCFIEHARGKRRFFDIGACHGVFSLVYGAIKPAGMAFSFEPHAKSYQELKLNSFLCGSIIPLNFALSEKTGHINMSEEWDMHLTASDTGESVECYAGDEFGLATRPDLLKIDVEGHEAKVLRGLAETIKDVHPTIFLEIHPERIQKEGESVIQMLHDLKELSYQPIDTLTNAPIDWAELAARTEESRIVLT